MYRSDLLDLIFFQYILIKNNKYKQRYMNHAPSHGPGVQRLYLLLLVEHVTLLRVFQVVHEPDYLVTGQSILQNSYNLDPSYRGHKMVRMRKGRVRTSCNGNESRQRRFGLHFFSGIAGSSEASIRSFGSIGAPTKRSASAGEVSRDGNGALIPDYPRKVPPLGDRNGVVSCPTGCKREIFSPNG